MMNWMPAMTHNVSPPPETLERRPEARAFKVEDLLNELRRGRMRIPSFQRGIKWQREDAAKLFDSLYRGFPIGTLLFWETHAEAGEVVFGTVRIGADARSDALWVVDGQQRLVSLARVLLAPRPDQDAFALYFDLDESRFLPPPPARGEDPSRWLPMTEVLESERLMQWVFAHTAQNQERRERAFSLGKRIREYDIPAYLVRTDREETLREVFRRINSTGKTLQQSEVFDALHGARAPSRPATIPQIATELETLDFGRVEDKLLYRLLRVLRGADVIEGRDEGPLRLSGFEAEQAYRQTTEAARRVVQFLMKEAGIPRYDLLPYKQPFVLLGKFFHLPAPFARLAGALGLARRAERGALRRYRVHPRPCTPLVLQPAAGRAAAGTGGATGRRPRLARVLSSAPSGRRLARRGAYCPGHCIERFRRSGRMGWRIGKEGGAGRLAFLPGRGATQVSRPPKRMWADRADQRTRR